MTFNNRTLCILTECNALKPDNSTCNATHWSDGRITEGCYPPTCQWLRELHARLLEEDQ